jgi:hypothetical protein
LRGKESVREFLDREFPAGPFDVPDRALTKRNRNAIEAWRQPRLIFCAKVQHTICGVLIAAIV